MFQKIQHQRPGFLRGRYFNLFQKPTAGGPDALPISGQMGVASTKAFLQRLEAIHELQKDSPPGRVFHGFKQIIMPRRFAQITLGHSSLLDRPARP